VNIEQGYATNGDGMLSTWTVTDSAGRTHTVYFKSVSSVDIQSIGPNFPSQTNYRTVVDKVVVQNAGGGSSTYQFLYGDPNVPSDTLSVPADDKSDAEGWPHSFDLPILRRIDLPDGSSYQMTYNIGTGSNFNSGQLSKLTLPTQGAIQWEYLPYLFPKVKCGDSGWMYGVSGVSRRSFAPPNGTIASDWHYAEALGRNLNAGCLDQNQMMRPFPNPQELTNTVTYCEAACGALNLPITKDVYHYTVLTEGADYAQPSSLSVGEYGSPQMRLAPYPSDPTRYLSVENFDCRPSCPSTPTRTKYIRYVTAGTVEDASHAITSVGDSVPEVDARVESERTVYEDGAVADTDRSDFDGFGHYRRTVTGGTFQFGTNIRTTITDFNPGSGPDGNINGHPLFGESDFWLPNTYDFSAVTEADAAGVAHTAKTESCFNGFGQPTRVRTLEGDGATPDAVSRDASDLLTVLDYDAAGNAVHERYYGGDNQGIDTGALCSMPLPVAPAYQLELQYTSGVVKKTTYLSGGVAMRFNSVDRDIGSTGLPTTDRDVSGLGTSLAYEQATGRLKTVTPPTGLATTTIDYANASMNGSSLIPAQATLTKSDLSNSFQFDAFGRLWREKHLMPDGTTSIRETLYDGKGRKTSVSEFEQLVIPAGGTEYGFSPVHKTTYTYDVFDRPLTITSPDNSVMTISYTGIQKTTRSVNVAMPGGPQPAVSISNYDRQGRLVSVTEKSGNTSTSTPVGADVTTSYTYDVGNRLHSVSTTSGAVTQLRVFEYDRRGFLISEQHPESGLTTYNQYDARGHNHHKSNAAFDIMTTFDDAERPKSIVQTGVGTLIDYSYDRPNSLSVSPPDYSLGKLDYAIRHNYQAPFFTDLTVKETYTYASPGGQISAKKTEIGSGPTFTESDYQYNDLGQVIAVPYPQCSGCGTITGPARQVTSTFANGFLRGVNGYTSATSPITYSANGLTNTVTHIRADGTNGPALAQTINSANGMARPLSIDVTGGCDSFAISVQPADTTLSAAGPAGLTVTASGATSYQWYQVVSSSSNALSGQTSSTLTTQVSTSGTFWVRVGNGTCTIDSRQATATVQSCSTPTSTITTSSSIAAGGSGTASVPVQSGAMYSWTITGGSITSSASASTITYSANCSGSVVLSVVVTSSCGSQSSGSRTVSITVPTAVASGDATISSGGSATITATLTGTAPWSITWSPDNFTQSNITTSSITRSVSPVRTTTYSISSMTGNGCNGSVSGTATVTVVPAAPTGLRAVLSANGSSIALSWNGTGADSYVVQRSYNNAPFTDYATGLLTPSFTDNDSQFGSRGVVTYVYQVMAVIANTRSSASSRAISTRVLFTDPNLGPGIPIRGIQMSEIRQAVDAVRASAGLPRIWSAVDYQTPLTGPVYAWLFYEANPTSPSRDLFHALNSARQSANLGLPAVSYPAGVAAPAIGGIVQWQHLDTIRGGVR
jgi:hypothetical protein